MTSQEIRDYSLSQTTLDDVFIHFASLQSEEGSRSESKERGEEREGESRHPLPDVVANSDEVSVGDAAYVL